METWASAISEAKAGPSDYELTIGQDFSIGYSSSDADSVDLSIEESLAFRINAPDAAVHLAYP